MRSYGITADSSLAGFKLGGEKAVKAGETYYVKVEPRQFNDLASYYTIIR